MPDEPKRIYWDSCIFRHYIEGTPEWMPILDALLAEAGQTNELVIYPSTAGLAERSSRTLAPLTRWSSNRGTTGAGRPRRRGAARASSRGAAVACL